MDDNIDDVTTPTGPVTPLFSLLGASGTHEFGRYFTASLIALGVDAGLLWALTEVAHVSYLWSGAAAFLAGISVIYILSVRWVFSHRTLRNWKQEIILFGLIGIVGLFINELILWILTSYFGFFYMISKLASVGVVFLWNFGARKGLLFRAAPSHE